MELHFAEAQPMIGVEFAGFLELMRQQIEDGDASAHFQNAVGGGDGAGPVGGAEIRVFGVAAQR